MNHLRIIYDDIDDNADCDSDDEKAFMKENFESYSKDDST